MSRLSDLIRQAKPADSQLGADLERKFREVRRLNTILEAVLAASRQAHAQDVANLAGAGTSVTALVARA